MTTERQLEANRQNAAKSTGPRTPEGRQIVAQNAVKHGLHSARPLISGEDPAEYDLFCLNFRKELCPQGPVENMLADRIISLSWRLRRAVSLQTGAYGILKNPEDGDTPSETESPDTFCKTLVEDYKHKKVVDNLLNHECRLEKSLYKTMLELQRLQFIRTKYQSLLADGCDYSDDEHRRLMHLESQPEPEPDSEPKYNPYR
jgi:hypothetical protein